MENRIEEDIKNAEHFIKTIKTDIKYVEENCWHVYYDKEIVELARILQNILSDYKRVLKENEELKKDYYNVINKIENKIDRFDYEFEKAKRQNNKDKSDYYWDLIINFKKLLDGNDTNVGSI